MKIFKKSKKVSKSVSPPPMNNQKTVETVSKENRSDYLGLVSPANQYEDQNQRIHIYANSEDILKTHGPISAGAEHDNDVRGYVGLVLKTDDDAGPPPEPDEPSFGEFVLDHQGIPLQNEKQTNDTKFEFDIRPTATETNSTNVANPQHDTNNKETIDIVEFYSDEDEPIDLDTMCAKIAGEPVATPKPNISSTQTATNNIQQSNSYNIPSVAIIPTPTTSSTMDLSVLVKKHWFLPNITRQIAETLVARYQPGAFLVRKSSQESCLALTFKHKNGTIQHGLLLHANGRWCVEGVPPYFDSLESLLRDHGGLIYSLSEKVREDFDNNKY